MCIMPWKPVRSPGLFYPSSTSRWWLLLRPGQKHTLQSKACLPDVDGSPADIGGNNAHTTIYKKKCSFLSTILLFIGANGVDSLARIIIL